MMENAEERRDMAASIRCIAGGCWEEATHAFYFCKHHYDDRTPWKISDSEAYARGFVDGAKTRSYPVEPALIHFLRDHAGHEFEVRIVGCGMFTVFLCTVCDHELALEAHGEEMKVIMGYQSGHPVKYPSDDSQ